MLAKAVGVTTVSFREQLSFDERRAAARTARELYPDRIPLICEPHTKILPSLEKCRLLVPADMPMVNVVRVLRRRLALTPASRLKLITDDGELRIAGHVAEVYSKYRASDDLLYIRYALN